MERRLGFSWVIRVFVDKTHRLSSFSAFFLSTQCLVEISVVMFKNSIPNNKPFSAALISLLILGSRTLCSLPTALTARLTPRTDIGVVSSGSLSLDIGEGVLLPT